MKDNFDVTKFELEDLELLDLGDAAEETRQFSPFPVYGDNVYGLGEWPG